MRIWTDRSESCCPVWILCTKLNCNKLLIDKKLLFLFQICIHYLLFSSVFLEWLCCKVRTCTKVSKSVKCQVLKLHKDFRVHSIREQRSGKNLKDESREKTSLGNEITRDRGIKQPPRSVSINNINPISNFIRPTETSYFRWARLALIYSFPLTKWRAKEDRDTELSASKLIYETKEGHTRGTRRMEESSAPTIRPSNLAFIFPCNVTVCSRSRPQKRLYIADERELPGNKPWWEERKREREREREGAVTGGESEFNSVSWCLSFRS